MLQYTTAIVGTIDEEKAAILTGLLQELSPLARLTSLKSVNCIEVIPQHLIVSRIHELIGSTNYSPGPHPAGAVTVPRDHEGSLQCVVVLNQAYVRDLQPGRVRPFKLVSSVLEELLHIRVYELRWTQQGTLYPHYSSDTEIQDIYYYCGLMHDEYVVDRHKAHISATNSLYDDWGGEAGTRTLGVLWYGGNVAGLIEAGKQQFELLAQLIESRQLSPDSAWPQLAAILYRHVLEPLARASAFRDGNPSNADPPATSDANQSRFYRDDIALFWDEMREVLSRSFEDGIPDIHTTTGELTTIAWSLLDHLDKRFD